MKKNNFIMFARIPAIFLAMRGSNESIVTDTRNGIARFQQLIVNKTFLIPPDRA